MQRTPELLFFESFCSSLFLCPYTFASIVKASIQRRGCYVGNFETSYETATKLLLSINLLYGILLSTGISINNRNGVSQKRLRCGIVSHFWSLCGILLRGLMDTSIPPTAVMWDTFEGLKKNAKRVQFE